MTPTHSYHAGRTVYWGNWQIELMERQPDPTLNFGVIVGRIPFALGSSGPVDGTIGSPLRKRLEAACKAWTNGSTVNECTAIAGHV